MENAKGKIKREKGQARLPRQGTSGQARPSTPDGATDGGQVMLLTVMLFSGAILGVVTLASLLILFQLRQTADIRASTQAIFAADAGIECVYNVRFGGYADGEPPASFPDAAEYESACRGTLSNGAEYRVVTEDAESIKSVGRAGRAARAFEIFIPE